MSTWEKRFNQVQPRDVPALWMEVNLDGTAYMLSQCIEQRCLARAQQHAGRSKFLQRDGGPPETKTSLRRLLTPVKETEHHRPETPCTPPEEFGGLNAS